MHSFLSTRERRVYSQNGEDGVLEAIFEVIGTTDKYYVEFGAQNGVECNTRLLREKHGWTGLLMDGGNEDLTIYLHREFVTAENIQELLNKYKVPAEYDLLSIDIDYNDWYVWRAIKSRPRVVVIEYNASHMAGEDRVIHYQAYGSWDGSNYFGASMDALIKLGQELGYTLVYAEDMGVNLFFVRDDVLSSVNDEKLRTVGASHEQIYRSARYGQGPRGGHPQDPLNRSYVCAEELLKST